MRPASWKEAFAGIAAKVKSADAKRIGAIAGDLAAVEEMFALKDLMTRLGSGNIDCRQDGAMLDPAWGRASYLFNATIAGIDKADALLIVGSNPRREAAVLNARIRKRWRAGQFPDRPDRRAGRSHISLRVSRRRCGNARRPAQGQVISPTALQGGRSIR